MVCNCFVYDKQNSTLSMWSFLLEIFLKTLDKYSTMCYTIFVDVNAIPRKIKKRKRDQNDGYFQKNQ